MKKHIAQAFRNYIAIAGSVAVAAAADTVTVVLFSQKRICFIPHENTQQYNV